MAFNTSKRLLAAAGLVLITSTSLAGCGSNGRPSVDEVSKALQAGKDPIKEPAVADCMAKVFVNSDISDETLRKAVDEGDKMSDEDVPAADQKAVESKEFVSGLMDCAKKSKDYQDAQDELNNLDPDAMDDSSTN